MSYIVISDSTSGTLFGGGGASGFDFASLAKTGSDTGFAFGKKDGRVLT